MISTRVPSAATGGSYTRLAATRSAGSLAAGAAPWPVRGGRLARTGRVRGIERLRDPDRALDPDRLRRAGRLLAARVGRDDERRARPITPSALRAHAARPLRSRPTWWR